MPLSDQLAGYISCVICDVQGMENGLHQVVILYVCCAFLR